jgi:glycosyltransferase involved in cell wall biosynthesis
MKTIHIIENIDNSYGGPAKSVPFLIKYLNKIAVENKIISIELKKEETNDICFENNIEIISSKYNGPKFLKFSNNFCKIITDEITKETILHTQSLWNYPPYCAYKIAKKNNVPLIMSIRGNLYNWNLNKSKWKKDLALNLFQMKMFQEASCLHATEPNELKAIRDLGITTPVALIPNGIEIDEFRSLSSKEQAKENLKLNSQKRYILFMSRIDSKKGLEYLINAYLKLSQNHTEWELFIAGPVYDKNYFDKINKNIRLHQAADRIHYFGMVSGQERLDLFAASELFILPAHTENFGMVIGEAMAAKLPVITTTGTPWKVLNDNNAGWWVDLNNDNITSSLEKAMLKNSLELKEMGTRGYEIIKNDFTWDEVAIKMKQVYEWLLNKREKPKFVFEDN